MTGNDDDERAIEVRVEEISQLFDTLDPFPFRERDLDSDAEEYIVGWARDLPRDQRLRIVIHVPASQITGDAARDLEQAFSRFFAYRADVVGRDLHELFRIGRRSLAIGLSVLGICLVAGQAIGGRLGAGQFERFVAESLIIVAWVANWRPLEIFLYDWWPLVRRRNLYRRLAAAAVSLRAAENERR